MIAYSTCRRCDGLLQVTGDETTHPLCEPRPTAAERLAQQWIDAVIDGDGALEAELQAQIEAIDSAPRRLLDAALLYASWGWPVFPIKSPAMAAQSRDPEKAKKAPATRNGFKDATTDPIQIRAWWGRYPDLNIGLPTGHAFDVIDVDVPEGVPALMKLAETDLKVHGHAATSSGGVHLYIEPIGGAGNFAGRVPGIDYRGIGGYVVAPPSTLGPRGRAWSWVHTPSPTITKKKVNQ